MKKRAWSHATGDPSGTVTLKAPQTPGVKEIRSLLDNGYEADAVSARIVASP